MLFRNKKVLLVGLGILGGGESAARFLLCQRASLTITDQKTKKELGVVVERLKKLKPKINFRLGGHDKADFKKADIVVFNQSIPVTSPWVRLARKYKKETETAFTIFGHILKKSPAEYIGITGTRGKTTVAYWVNHFIPNSILGGNIPGRGELEILSAKGNPLRRKGLPFVLELSSFQLEFNHKKIKQPKIAIITNLYNDHLNRYGTFKNYFKTKANIFRYQTKNNFLILNKDDSFTKKFLTLRPKSKIYFTALSPLLKKEKGLFILKNKIYFQETGKIKFITNVPREFAMHQKYNLLTSMLGAYFYLNDWEKIISKIKSLPDIPYRQEMIFPPKVAQPWAEKKQSLLIINDSAATSPDATIAAIEKFSKGLPFGTSSRGALNLILITGGTDKKLEFKKLAKVIKKYILKKNLYLLDGSATKKLLSAMNQTLPVYQNLDQIIKSIKLKKSENIILFSPGAASFEKFKNEFDRGRQFTRLIKNKLKLSLF